MTTDPPIAARGYQYKHGDRPLDGYVIQRGVGRGGFGEVYYAVSDSGREVALKVVNTYEQVELRGISQCMNLKNPHLVTVFDVKYGQDGRPWVIMEFVAGPCLSELLAAAPNGLGTAKAAFFLREIGKGLNYLHESGIVHRDLKPANIFYENGLVKIGDYGLSKAMSVTRHSGQTVAVGTLHYMAPEIGEGCYDRSIDIYALGALLYELLTGQVPFGGSSPAEVLMKHLSSEVNLEGVEEPFKSVIRKAMAKDPAQRFGSASEMVEAVFASEQVRQSVSGMSPESLGSIPGGARPQARSSNRTEEPWGDAAQRVADRVAKAAERIKEAGDRVGERLGGARLAAYGAGAGAAGPDTMTKPARIVLAAMAVVMAAFVATISASRRQPEIFFYVLGSIAGTLGTALAAWRWIAPGLARESKWVRNVGVGGPAAFGALYIGLVTWGERFFHATTLAIFFSLLCICWEKRLLPDRKERFSVGLLFTSGVLALIVAAMFDADAATVMASVAGASLAVSLAAPWRGRGWARPMSPPPRPYIPPAQAQPFAPGVTMPPPGAVAQQAAAEAGVTPPLRTTWGAAIPAYDGVPGMNILGVGLAVFVVVALLRGRVVSFFPLIFVPMAILLLVSRKNRRYAAAYGQAPIGVGGLFGIFFRSILSTIGTGLLVVSMAIAVAVLTNIPGLLESGTLDRHLPAHLRRAFGTDDWPRVMLEIGTAASVATALGALILFLMARRCGGGLHMLRGLFGIATMFLGVKVFAKGLPDWSHVPTFPRFDNAVMDWYFAHANMSDVVNGAFFASIALVILMWPPRRRVLAAQAV